MGSFKDLAKLRGLAEAGLVVKTASQQAQARRDDELRKRREAEEAAARAVLANAPRYPWARAATLAEARALLTEHEMVFSIAGRGEVEAIPRSRPGGSASSTSSWKQAPRRSSSCGRKVSRKVG